MNFPTKALAFTFILFFCTGISAQTKVSGKVFDSETQEALPFVNLLFKGTKTGTTTDFDGNYSITTSENVDSLIISYVGYDRKSVKVKNGVDQSINIQLNHAGISLTEVVVKPGENPAHIILRKVIANKYRNDKERLDAYQYEVYNKVEFDLNNLSKEFQQKKLLKPINFIFNNIDSTNVNEKPFLPLFITESLSDYYFKRKPRMKKEIIKANKMSGVNDASIAQFMGEMYLQANIYDNSMVVFQKSFSSPISDNGLLFYKYYLIDSMFVGGHWCYQIQFKQKHPQELVFEGNMWIADTTFGVKRLEMSIAKDANINFVKALIVAQEYIYTDSVWMLNKDKLVVDFALQKKKMGVYGRKSTSYKNFKIDKPEPDDFYSLTKNLIVDADADKKDDQFWKDNRHDTLSKNEVKIYKMVDTIQSLPIYKTWIDIAKIIFVGYKIVGNFEIGPYSNMLSFNSIEGPRFRLGGRTSDKFSKWYELSGYVAYGLKDEEFKYQGAFKTFISKNPRQLVGISYKKDYEILGQSPAAFTQDNILSSIFRTKSLLNLTGIEQTQAYYDYEFFTGLNTKLIFGNKKYTPILGQKYKFYQENNAIRERANIITSEITLQTRFAYDEKYVEGTFTRASLGTKYPVLQLQYTLGTSGLFNSQYDYHKVTLNIDDRLRFNPIGYTNYIIEGGQTFGQVPYPLLFVHPGNQTLIYDYASFNLMNFFEFASDRYATMSIFHHFEGFFFNKVPLFRKLKWREVFIAKALVGTLSQKQKDIMVFPNNLSELNRGPYYEVGAGVENILKVFRVDAFWRLSYLSNPNISKFGIRWSIQLTF